MYKKSKDRIRNKIKSAIIGYINVVVVVLALVLVVSLINNIKRIRKSAQRIDLAEDRLEGLKQKNDSLKAQIDVVESDFFIETQLRDKLGLSKEGEIVVVLPEDDVLRKFAPKYEEEETSLPDPNWKKWLKMFM